MNAVLVHIGCIGPYITGTEPPAYLERCIDQYLIFNNTDLHILTDRANIPLLKKRTGVFPAAIEDYASAKVARFESLFNYSRKEFWTVSTTRLIYLENFLRERDLHHVCHFENDVLVYFNLEEYGCVFKQLYPNMAATPCDPDHLTSGFMYINDYTALEHMTDFFIKILAEHGVGGVIEKFKVYMVNDMTLMRRYADHDGAGRVGLLPVMPFGVFSQGFDQFNAIFDAAGWGQFVTGTRTCGPGTTYAGHIVGGVLRAHPEYQIAWEVEDGLRFPYFSYDDNRAKLNSLHVHSKNMCPYMSEACE